MRISDWSSDVCSSDLSFPMAGWTLALDFAVGPSQLTGLLDDLDDRVTEAGGRCYLAKDGRSRRELLPGWSPRLHEWRPIQPPLDRSEERRVGTESGKTGSNRWEPDI